MKAYFMVLLRKWQFTFLTVIYVDWLRLIHFCFLFQGESTLKDTNLCPHSLLRTRSSRWKIVMPLTYVVIKNYIQTFHTNEWIGLFPQTYSISGDADNGGKPRPSWSDTPTLTLKGLQKRLIKANGYSCYVHPPLLSRNINRLLNFQ